MENGAINLATVYILNQEVEILLEDISWVRKAAFRCKYYMMYTGIILVSTQCACETCIFLYSWIADPVDAHE